MNDREIAKYRIPVQPMSTVVMMREGTVVKCVGVQRAREVCLWAERPVIDHPNGNVVGRREFVTVGTGEEVLDSWVYVGTAFDGEFVWHVYEIPS